jgi:glycerol-3-phosphate acyltransferase PlsX
MAGALLTLGRIKGIGRPALATVFPTGEGHLTILLDVGANADCRPIHLLQFAYMGAAYMERVYKIGSPKVGLLSIGEEDSKGNQLTIEVNEALRASRLNFIGNVEGKDLTKGVCDVAVMDGFTGNVVLKTAEGMAELLLGEIRKAVELTPWNRAAGLILMSELRKVKRRLDYAEYGGAQLVGVNGIVVIGHGRSNARAVFSAIRAARDAVETGVIETLREVAREIPARTTLVGSAVPDPEDD